MNAWDWIKEQTLVTKLNLIVLMLSIIFLLFGVVADRKDIVDYIYIVLFSLAVYFSLILVVYLIKRVSIEDAETKRYGYKSSYLSDIVSFILQIITFIFL